MAYTLFPHQERGAAFLTSEPGTKGLFFGMGTGKTRTALEALIEADVLKALIIGPPISLRMWANEAADHMNCTPQILAKGSTEIDPNADTLICSYEIATKRQHELMMWARPTLMARRSALICDESHALKSTKAKRTKAAEALAEIEKLRRNKVCLAAKRRASVLAKGASLRREREAAEAAAEAAATEVATEASKRPCLRR